MAWVVVWMRALIGVVCDVANDLVGGEGRGVDCVGGWCSCGVAGVLAVVG